MSLLTTEPAADAVSPSGPAGSPTLLRIATAGSVDDGKSTLVGRLLHDAKAVLADQLAAVEQVSRDKGWRAGSLDLALLTDGLRAEREQGITIDVAYRYFATARRSFILADCPGHVQYTRNTVTGASTADVVVVLLDARTGVVEQTRRHLAVAALLRVPHVVVAVNKVDLVSFDGSVFDRAAVDVAAVADRLGLPDVRPVPVSALHGDNVVERSRLTPWYAGPSLLELLETLPAGDGAAARAFRLPVQLVIRPQAAARLGADADYRGYAGQIASGGVSVGDEVAVLPAGVRSRVVAIDVPRTDARAGAARQVAVAGESVTLRLADTVDVARGDVIVPAAEVPELTRDLAATLCWLSERPGRAGDRVLIKHGTRTVPAVINGVTGRLDLTSLALDEADSLGLNDIGRAELRLASALPVEDYSLNQATGAFLVIDPHDGSTLAAGMARCSRA